MEGNNEGPKVEIIPFEPEKELTKKQKDIMYYALIWVILIAVGVYAYFVWDLLETASTHPCLVCEEKYNNKCNIIPDYVDLDKIINNIRNLDFNVSSEPSTDLMK